MRRMTCTYEPNTDLRTRVIVRRASSRRGTSLEEYAGSNRLAEPPTFVRPYAVAHVPGIKERSPSPLTITGTGRDYNVNIVDIERGEDGGFIGPAAYDPVSPDQLDFGDKTQVMLLR
ncbi:hypothetical protein PoB_003893300 [Plakobranchus ocellatus]|uniref:Uncharacterized protein n=1 Tax=Plakobranchus ocellatus TaxID=259542 RepID=A0AAV4AYM7_9GAST|nr:hypothetical protein PoB_003893300 [Plakobranchus ocellatus]